MRIVRSLVAMEGEEMGRGRLRRGTTQDRFAEEDESDLDAARIVEQILAKLGPDLHHSREPRRKPPKCPPAPGQDLENSTKPLRSQSYLTSPEG